MDALKGYYVYQGKINGQSIGKGVLVQAKGPKSAMKMLFPDNTVTETTQKVVFGSTGNQFGMVNGNMQFKAPKGQHKQPMNWVQLNRADKDEAHFYLLK